MSSTHHRKLARQLADADELPYTEALSRVRSAADRGLLPARLAGDGHIAALAVLRTIGAAPPPTSPAISADDESRAPADVLSLGPSFELTLELLEGHVAVLAKDPSVSDVIVAAFGAAAVEAGWAVTHLSFRDGSELPTFADGAVTVSLENPDGFGFDPFAGLGAGDVTELVVAVQDTDDKFWRTQAALVVRQATDALFAARQIDPERFAPVTLSSLATALTQSPSRQLAAAAKVALDAGVLDEVATATLRRPSSDNARAAQMCGTTLQLCWTEGRELFSGAVPLPVTGDGVTHVGLAESPAGRFAGAAVVRQLLAGNRGRRLLIMDDVSGVPASELPLLVRRVRRAGVVVVFVVPGPLPADLEMVNVHIGPYGDPVGPIDPSAGLVNGRVGVRIRPRGRSIRAEVFA